MNPYQNLFEYVEQCLVDVSLDEIESTQMFQQFCTAKALEIQNNYPNGRTFAEIYSHSKYGYLNEFILSKALNIKSNDLEFDARNPDSFCYDLYSDNFGKIEVKSWNSTKSKWLNFNLLSKYNQGYELLQAGHFDTLCKYANSIDLVITVYQENNRLKVSGVFSSSVFALNNGRTYGTYVRESRVLPSGNKTSHYLDINKVKSSNLGYFK
jgi:hypothetical protein